MITWGKIDLNKDKVRMWIGISGDTMRRAFGIKNLPKDYFFTMPLKGSTSNASIDAGKAASRIAAMRAKQSAQRELGIIGGLIGALISDDQKDPPSPTTSPLPWAGQESQRSWYKEQQDDDEPSPLPRVFDLFK